MRVAIAIILLCSSTAFAQTAPPDAQDAAHAPGFVTLDRFDATSRAGAEVSYLSVNDDGGDVTALHFDVHAQYVTPRGTGGYVQLPINYVTGIGGGLTGNSDSVTALGDLEVGGIYIANVGQTKVPVHAGLTLPTASDSLDKAIYGPVVQLGSRVTDLYETIPKGTSLRVGVSPLYRSGQIFARVDIGIDLNLDNAGDNSTDTFLRLNGGIGYELGTAAVMAELVNEYVTSGNGGWANMAAITARLTSGDIQPYGGLLIPLDDDTQQIVDLTLTAGLDVALH